MNHDPHSLSPLQKPGPAPGGPKGRKRERRTGTNFVLVCTLAEHSSFRPGPGLDLAVELRDISWGGLQFVSREPLFRPCTLNIQIKNPADGDVLNARGDVAWCETRRVGVREVHLVGVQFDEIFTPLARCVPFFGDPYSAALGSITTTLLPVGRMRRRRPRFRVDNYKVTVCRPARFWIFGGSKNVATSLNDLSAEGAQVVCSEALRTGVRVCFTLYLTKFADTFKAQAEVVWNRQGASTGGPFWTVGLHFRGLDEAAQKLILHIASWFTSKKAGLRRQT